MPDTPQKLAEPSTEVDATIAAVSAAADTVDPEYVDPANLKFDHNNPRFTEHGLEKEEDLVRFLYDQADVDELIQSILSAGYIDFEPFIVERGTNTVLEGNRRLAALRLIVSEDLRKRLKISLPPISNAKPAPTKVRVRWVNGRAEARAFIGFKHINGPFKWDALAKAKYAAEWFQEGGDVETISRTLGDNHNTVKRLVNGWYVLQQAKDDGFDPEQRSKKTFAFSHLYTALTRSSVREMVGLTADDLSTPKPNPIPADKREELQTLMSWLYGQEQRKEPAIIESQNPNLNELSKVLANPEARLTLRSTRNLARAFEKVEPPSGRFDEALTLLAKQAEDTMALSGHYSADPTVLKVAEGLQRTVRSLVVVMKDKVAEQAGGE
jgi:hypothetical protein